VAYAFSHPRDLYEAGVAAILFGGGAGCSTRPATDGGFLAAQGKIAYNLPVTVTGLSVGSVTGSAVVSGSVAALRWDENVEPDSWGYRLRYAPSGRAASGAVTVNGANSASLLLPSAGTWRIEAAAFDAMGQVGPYSPPVTVTALLDAERVWLPLILKR